MREALAAADHDFILSEPQKPAPRARRAAGAGARKRAPRSQQKSRRFAGVIVSALCVAALGGIVINALTLQKARHSAPLFGAAKEPQTAAPAPVAAPVPAPRPQQVVPVRAESEPAAAGVEDRPASAALRTPAAPAQQAKPHDAISELLLGPTHEAQPAASKSVLAAQKALVKLGYVLKPDGRMGASTKQAIERYERDRGRPARGDLTPALAKNLSAESGLPIN